MTPNNPVGRWLSPDALGGDIMNPQSLNRYGYALNNPATLNDPTGLDSCFMDSCGVGADAATAVGAIIGGPIGALIGSLFHLFGLFGGGPPPPPPAGQPPLAGVFVLCGVIMRRMSRLRRMVLSERFFFVTCRVHRRRRELSESEFSVLAEVVRERRKAHPFLLTAWVFLPDHWHAIIFPRSRLTISQVMESIKVSASRLINRDRGERGVLFQGRFFDRALRTVKEYNEKVAYIPWNPVKAGLVARPADWKWSSVHDYTGTVNAPAGRGSPISIDHVLMPSDERTRI
jgi:REP-associated tyrosine transposase